MSLCDRCLKLINGTGLICSNCGICFHHACVDSKHCTIHWICTPCSLQTLPFNQLASDCDFLNAIFELCNSSNIDFDRLNNLCFNPFDISEHHDNLNLINCSYYLNESFNQLVKEANNTNFSVFHLNGRSVSKHFDSISDYISTLNHNFSIYGFSETRFKDTPSPLIHMKGYGLVHTPRTHRGGGGVAMLVSDKLNFKLRNDLQFAGYSYESIFVEVICDSGKNIVVGTVT